MVIGSKGLTKKRPNAKGVALSIIQCGDLSLYDFIQVDISIPRFLTQYGCCSSAPS